MIFWFPLDREASHADLKFSWKGGPDFQIIPLLEPNLQLILMTNNQIDRMCRKKAASDIHRPVHFCLRFPSV